jgi:ComF family protein
MVLPSPCYGCDAPLSLRSQELNLGAGCRADLPRPDDHLCRLCGAFTATDCWLCLACGRRPPVDEVLRALKFGQLEYLASQIASELLAERHAELLGHDLVTAVPLHWRRRLERSFNQAALIARPLAQALDLPFRRLLRRTRATTSQSGLARDERRRNVRGCFRSTWIRAPGIRLEGACVVLVDDVATTGATLDEASLVLKAEGAARVTAVAAARTPLSLGTRCPQAT